VKRIKGCTLKLIRTRMLWPQLPPLVHWNQEGEHILRWKFFFSSKPIKKQNFYNQKQSVPNTKAYGYVKNEFSPTKHAIRFFILLVYQAEKQNQLKARKHKTFSYQSTEEKHTNIFLFSEPCFLSTYFTNLNMMLQLCLLKFLFYTEIYF